MRLLSENERTLRACFKHCAQKRRCPQMPKRKAPKSWAEELAELEDPAPRGKFSNYSLKQDIWLTDQILTQKMRELEKSPRMRQNRILIAANPKPMRASTMKTLGTKNCSFCSDFLSNGLQQEQASQARCRAVGAAVSGFTREPT